MRSYDWLHLTSYFFIGAGCVHAAFANAMPALGCAGVAIAAIVIAAYERGYKP